MRRVDPSVYTKEYYLTDCTGHTEFKKSFGKILEPRFKELIRYFVFVHPDMKVLDIGCGRGEMVLYAAEHGGEAVGIDYSKDAIELAEKMKSKQPDKLQKHMKFHVMDIKKMSFKNSTFDFVFMTDVIEHLYPEELDIAMKEIKRVLKPRGMLVIHTAPNKLFNDIAYPYYSYPISSALVALWNLLFARHYPNIARPEEIRTDSHHIMHINEQTYFSLRSLFKRHKFIGTIESTNITSKKPNVGIKDIFFNLFVFFHPFSKHFPINAIFGSDFISVLFNRK